MKLSELKNGETAVIVRLSGHGGFRKRIMEMGFIRGEKVKSVLDSPMHDPVKYHVMGYDVLLRRSEAAMIEVLPEEEARKELTPAPTFTSLTICDSCSGDNCTSCMLRKISTRRNNVINVALVGNPNSGKTSMFNSLANQNEHVGNYSGVTVGAKCGNFNYKGYRINLTDLPGTYSIAAYSPEEIYVRKHLFEQIPDVIINTVVASNIERNLYLTTELIDMNLRTVVALNMYDELLATGAQLDYEHLGAMMGIPMIPTVAKNGMGLDKLLDTIIELFEGNNKTIRHIHINYGNIIEEELAPLSAELHKANDLPQQFPVRYWALKLLEGDKEIPSFLGKIMELPRWQHIAEKNAKSVQAQIGVDVETAISGAKYGFINGALQETFKPGNKDTQKKTRSIDRLVASRWLGFPIFLLVMWAMFSTVFLLGAYPQEWIENLFGWMGEMASGVLPDGAFKDLVVNGIIGGVGSVAVFIPQILILYLFISLMEDSGYMARAAFIMDRLMHKMGLHGKSFIPMLMGFGCNVPAIMATRTIESRSSRLITILVTPFMSCSARLPVMVLFAGAFFPGHAPLVLIGLYLLGIAGGMNNDGATSDVYSLDLENDCKAEALPSLPCTIDNTAAAINGEKVFVVGGNADGKASNRVFTLDLAATEKGWQELPAMPSRPRVQPVCAATAEALYVWGGFCPADSLNYAITHCDGARYIFAEQRWEQLPDVRIEGEKEPFSLSGGVAMVHKGRIIAAGGVNKDIFTDAISGRYSLTSKEEYMHHPAEWYRFNSRLAAYDPQKGCWELISNDKAFARAGAAMTANGNDIIYIGGELKPGIRTPETSIFKQ